jgi:phospholipase C
MQTHNPIEHVVIVVKENHTFDNYFGTFPNANGDATLQHAPDPPVSDPPHDHAGWLERLHGAVKQRYIEADIPAYFAYARQFTLCDNYFSEIASQSEPNHLVLVAAASPIIDNSSRHRTYQPQAPFDLPSLPVSLEQAGLTWKTYGDPVFSYFEHIAALKGSRNIVPWTQFDTDAAAGMLPSVSWVYAPPEFSEHPPGAGSASGPVVSTGMQWTAGRITQVAKSKLWASTAIFITWDDWGGWYDHSEPPLKETWTGGGPANGPAYTDTQFSYGPRVPCLVLSPYSRPGYISRAFHSHVSLVKFCEMTFGLSPLNDRDPAFDGMQDCFDFSQAPLPAPGTVPAPVPTPRPKKKPRKRHHPKRSDI